MPKVSWEVGAAEAKLGEIFRRVLMVEGADLSPVTMDSLGEQWSSLRHVDLIMTVQGAFGFRFDYNEIVEIRSYEALRLSTLKHLSRS